MGSDGVRWDRTVGVPAPGFRNSRGLPDARDGSRPVHRGPTVLGSTPEGVGCLLRDTC